MKEPIWVTPDAILTAHFDAVNDSESSGGLRDAGLLASALARPWNFLFYEGDSADIFDVAACYAEAIVRNHPFVDGNKRTAFTAAALFLDINGYEITGNAQEQARMMTALAAGSLTREAAADFLRRNSKAI